jgi:hypothetical protein
MFLRLIPEEFKCSYDNEGGKGAECGYAFVEFDKLNSSARDW